MFKQRSTEKELLDGPIGSMDELHQNLHELDVINRLLGGYRITLNALEKVLCHTRNYTLIDIGSGGGDTLKRIDNWSRKKNFRLALFGLDYNEACVNYSNINRANQRIKFICDDYRNIALHIPQIDIIHASLFCHHLSRQELIELIGFAQKNKAILIINDLERHWFAYYSIKLLTRIFSKTYLVKNDAPLSVLRGFKIHEWNTILKESGVQNFTLTKKWAFRHELIIHVD